MSADRNKTIIVGSGDKAQQCCEFLTKYGYEVAFFAAKREGEAISGVAVKELKKVDLSEIAAIGGPILFAANDPIFSKSARKILKKAGTGEDRFITDSYFWSGWMTETLDFLTLNNDSRPNEYLECIFDNYPMSGKKALEVLIDYQREKIKGTIDPAKKTLGVYYPSPAYRSNLGGEAMYDTIREQGYNVLFLFGTIAGDKYEKRPGSFYVGRGIIKHLDFVDVCIYPTLNDDLPERTKKILFVHDIYDSPRGKAEAPIKSAKTGKPVRVSPLIDELDYTFLPCKALMPKSHKMTLIRKKPLCRIPGGYIKLDRNIHYFENADVSVDSIIYAPTVCNDQFEKYVSLPAHGEMIVGAMLDAFGDKYKIIFRPHPHTIKTRYVADLVKRFKGTPGFAFDSNPSFYMENYSSSQLMITDMSGTAFTYAFTTLRPVVFFSHREETVEEAFDGVRYFNDRKYVGYVASNEEELKEKVALGLGKIDEFKGKIREFRDSEVYNAGKAEQYFADNFHYIADGKEHPDWQYVECPIAPPERGDIPLDSDAIKKKIATNMPLPLKIKIKSFLQWIGKLDSE